MVAVAVAVVTEGEAEEVAVEAAEVDSQARTPHPWVEDDAGRCLQVLPH